MKHPMETSCFPGRSEEPCQPADRSCRRHREESSSCKLPAPNAAPASDPRPPPRAGSPRYPARSSASRRRLPIPGRRAPSYAWGRPYLLPAPAAPSSGPRPTCAPAPPRPRSPQPCPARPPPGAVLAPSPAVASAPAVRSRPAPASSLPPHRSQL